MVKISADFLTYIRMAFCVPMLFFAYYDLRVFFVIVYLGSLGLDVMDGHTARKLKSESEFGKRLDIIADNIIAGVLIVSIYMMKPASILGYSRILIFLVISAAVFHMLSLMITRSLVMMATRAARFSAILFPVAFLSLLLFGIGLPIYLFSIAQLYSMTEKFFLHLTMKKSILKLSIVTMALFFFIFISSVLSLLYIMRQGEVCFERKCIDVEAMRTPEERALGLMFRTSMDEDRGMLFIFETPGIHSFWMKNMQMDIDMVFIGADKKIAYIAKNALPCKNDPCEIYTPPKEIKYVVETAPGFSDKFGLGLGQEVFIDE